MRDVDCETVKGNMWIVYIEKFVKMYEGDCEAVRKKYEDCVH